MSAIDKLTDLRLWDHVDADEGTELSEVNLYGGNWQDIPQAAAEVAALRAENATAETFRKAWNERDKELAGVYNELESLREKMNLQDAIMEAVRKYIRGHQAGCSWKKFSDREKRHCSCGYFELEAALKAVAP